MGLSFEEYAVAVSHAERAVQQTFERLAEEGLTRPAIVSAALFEFVRLWRELSPDEQQITLEATELCARDMRATLYDA